MFITPMSKIDSLAQLQQTKLENLNENKAATPFHDIFSNVINSVTETDKYLAQQEYLVASGQQDDAHTLPIASAQAQLSLDLLIQLRSKAMDSYNELMRISL